MSIKLAVRIYAGPMLINRTRGSVVCIATGYGPDDREVGVRVPVGSRIFSSPDRPDRLWGPPNLVSNGYRRLFPRGGKRPGREADPSLTSSEYLDQENTDLYIHSPIRLHGVVLNSLSTGTTLPLLYLC
jgi:hypothetical protein